MSDECTWSADYFAGVFSTRDKAEEGIQELLERENRKHHPNFAEQDFHIIEVDIDQLDPDLNFND